MIIFEKSRQGRCAKSLQCKTSSKTPKVSPSLLRADKALLPEVSELEVVRHFTNLSRKNFSIDAEFYPLGSCTMKYNPRAAHKCASLPGFVNRHPLAPVCASQGYLQAAYELQTYLAEVTGMKGASLTPMAGAQGELAGVAMIRAYHEARADHNRDEIIVPDAAHGTNPASAVMCGFKVKEIPTGEDGDIDVEALKAALSERTAGIMLTNPSTVGVFERDIQTVSKLVHDAGGLLYYDGANLNAIVGKVRPGDMGFDVLHFNLHKTFATPHGGGGPGAGPVAVSERLKPYLPGPIVLKENDTYRYSEQGDLPNSIGRLSTFMGNAGVLLRAYIYARLLGREGMPKVAEMATLNANYLMKKLSDAGFKLAYPGRRASHEFIITLSDQAKAYGVTAKDYGKRLLDYGIHAPTTYFPIHVPECLLIEPTETETQETLDRFIEAMIAIKHEAEMNAELVKTAPHTMPVRRLDDVKAARELDIVFKPKA